MSSVDSKITSLTALFPNARWNDITYAVTVYDNIDSAADHLTEIYAPELENVTSDDNGVNNANLAVSRNSEEP